MANNSFKIKNSVHLDANTSATSEAGDVRYNSDRLIVRDSSTERNLTTDDGTITLTNKTIDADNNTISNLAHGAEVDNPSSGVHGVVGSVVGTSDAQTLTNKTIDADNNTISNLAHGAEVDNPSSGVHGVTGSVVGTTDTQTLTNKTLTTPSTDVITLSHQTTPSTPSAGFNSIYAKSDNALYILDSGGTESAVGGGDVVGPGSAADTSLVTFDGTTGKLVQDQSIATFNGNSQLSLTNKGSQSFPAITFTGDEDTGIYSEAANSMSFAVGGNEVIDLDNTIIYPKYQMRSQHTPSISSLNYCISASNTGMAGNLSGTVADECNLYVRGTELIGLTQTGIALNMAPTWTRQTIADTNDTVTVGDHIISYTSITATRTVTLPAAATAGAGYEMIIMDESGSVTPSIMITVDGNGAETINGATTHDIVDAYGWVKLLCTGSAWVIIGRNRPLNRWQINTLSADVTTNITMSDLTFSNLVTGRVYRATLQAYMQGNSTDSFVQANIVHNSANIAFIKHGFSGISADEVLTSSVIFVAAASTVTFVSASASANAKFNGNGTQNETFSMLEELNTFELTESSAF